ncbi:MAG TPA: 50S ribosomal protein L6 [Patescibacteria group bacterium]|nr:50S ribosomal protein L6 [Patescibacteria group bacterium]
MSNVAKKPVKIEDGVTVNIDNQNITVMGPKGELKTKVPYGVTVEIVDGHAVIKKVSDSHDLEKFAGLMRSMVANMVTGVTSGFTKQLELTGVGYRARVDGANLVLNVGYALPVTIKPIDGVTIAVAENVITVSGSNKQFVGDVASDIRAVRPPDPYKGKGIKYMGEKIRRKVGKAAKAVGGK